MRNDYDLDENEDDDPNDPSHRDYDLSTSAPYDYDRPADEKPWFLRRGVMLLVGLLLVLSLMLPYIWRIS
jgi:hypothetical protein